jgi:hypothetical protein
MDQYGNFTLVARSSYKLVVPFSTCHSPNSLSYHSRMTSPMSSPKSDIAAFLHAFRQTIEFGAGRLSEINETQSAIPRSEGKWSPKEIIGHLIDSAANNHQRFVRAQFTDELIFAGYEQENWVRVQNYQGENWRDMVQLWKLYNQHILHLVSLIPEDTRMKLRSKHNLHKIASDTISENEPVTLDYFIRDYLDHMRKHLGQILGEDVVAQIG